MHRFRRAICTTIVIVVTGSGCVGEKTTAPVLKDPNTTIGSVAVSPHNAIVAVGGKVKLSVTSQSITGAPVTTFDSVRYILRSVADTLRVQLSPDGEFTGLAPSGSAPVVVRAFAYRDGVGKGDESIIQVTQTALSGLTLSIQPIPPDSTRLERNASKVITPVIRNPVTAESVTGPTLRLTTKAADRLVIAGYETLLSLPGTDGPPISFPNPFLGSSTNRIKAIAGEGSGWVHAEVDAYGAVLRDSVKYTATWPFTATVSIDALNMGIVAGGFRRDGENLKLAPSATVTFQNGLPASGGASIVTFTFDNPNVATVSALAVGESSDRQFLVPGIYTWTATVGGSAPPFSGQTTSSTITIK